MLDRILIGSSADPSDPNFKNVTLLLHGDGSNGAQNNTFLDSSTNNFTITRNGNTTQGSFSPYGSNWSNYFDGSGDYARIASSQAALQFGTGDFTVEGWVFSSNGTGTFQHILTGGTSWSTGSGGVFWYYNSGSPTLGCAWNQVTPNPAIQSGTLAVNTWHHFAVVRSGNTLTLYINGSSVGTLSVTGISLAVNNQSQTNIGGGGWDNDFAGYVSNLRVLKGAALYTSNFTPSTTPLTAITNTSLLTCQSNRFRDASTNNFTITGNGGVKVTNFAPFAPSAAYSTSVNGGSAYFDGTGDYLTAPDNAALQLGSSDFTIEFWVNFSVVPGSAQGATLVSKFNTSNVGYEVILFNNTLYFQAQSANISLTYAWTPNAGRWYHIAWTRSGANSYAFIDGTLVASTSGASGSITNLAQALQIGRRGDDTFYLTGYMSNVRVVKGTAVYTAAFTPPSSPVTAITNTSLLTNFTNAAIFDNSMKNDLETVGNAQISTSIKKFGTGSIAFDGSGDYLVTPKTQDLNLSSGNWTIEGWFYPNNSSTNMVFAMLGNTNSDKIVLATLSPNGYIAYLLNGTLIISTTSAVANNAWSHFALVKNGSTTTLYVNGTSAGTTTSVPTSSDKFFGAGRDVIGGGAEVNGYIDDFRITNGVARYTANFTAPTAPFPNK